MTSHVPGDDRIDQGNPAEMDEALRLIGLFFVKFSTYITHLEFGIGQAVSITNPVTNRIMESVLGALGADDLREQFFSATALARTPTDEENRIRRELRRRGKALTEARNDLAHGAWYLSSSTGVGTDTEPLTFKSFEPRLFRTRAARGGPEPKTILESRGELEDLVNEAEELAALVWEYRSGVFLGAEDRPGVTDRLGFEGDRLVKRDLTGWTPSGGD